MHIGCISWRHSLAPPREKVFHLVKEKVKISAPKCDITLLSTSPPPSVTLYQKMLTPSPPMCVTSFMNDPLVVRSVIQSTFINISVQNFLVYISEWERSCFFRHLFYIFMSRNKFHASLRFYCKGYLLLLTPEKGWKNLLFLVRNNFFYDPAVVA